MDRLYGRNRNFGKDGLLILTVGIFLFGGLLALSSPAQAQNSNKQAQATPALVSVEVINPVHKAQLLSYLKMSGLSLGLLINFNVPKLVNGVNRIINTSASL